MSSIFAYASKLHENYFHGSALSLDGQRICTLFRLTIDDTPRSLPQSPMLIQRLPQYIKLTLPWVTCVIGGKIKIESEKRRVCYFIMSLPPSLKRNYLLGKIFSAGIGVTADPKVADQFFKESKQVEVIIDESKIETYFVKFNEVMELAFEPAKRIILYNCGSELDRKIVFQFMFYLGIKPKPEHLYYLGCVCLFGIGAKENYETAFRYFNVAAELGFVPAIYNLGCCYKLGIGTEQDIKLSLYFYQKAALLGHKESIEELELYEKDC